MDAQFIMAREEWETPTGTYEEIQVRTSSGKTKTLTRCVTCKIEIHNTHTLHRHAKGKTHKRKMELVKIATEKVIACEIKRKRMKITTDGAKCILCGTGNLSSKFEIYKHLKGRKHDTKRRLQSHLRENKITPTPTAKTDYDRVEQEEEDGALSDNSEGNRHSDARTPPYSPCSSYRSD